MSLAALLQETAAAADAAVTAAPFWRHDLSPDLVRIPFPKFGAIQDGIPIRYYSLAYLLGLMAAWWLLRRLSRQRRIALDENGVADLIIPYALLGVMLGGRIGYVLFYDVDGDGRWAWLRAPWKVVQIWEGGMASHGAFVGVLLALAWWSRRHRGSLLGAADLVVTTVPAGLCLGRIANFINGELVGDPSSLPWAVIFPREGAEPRHPSQLYEAFAEGLLPLLWVLRRYPLRLPSGRLAGEFLLLYSAGRIVCEAFRSPDDGYGLGLTAGQVWTLPLAAFGAYLVWRAHRRTE